MNFPGSFYAALRHSIWLPERLTWIMCWWSYVRRGIQAGGVGEEEDEREEKQLRRVVILVCLP
jgi:hypothetical protein